MPLSIKKNRNGKITDLRTERKLRRSGGPAFTFRKLQCYYHILLIKQLRKCFDPFSKMNVEGLWGSGKVLVMTRPIKSSGLWVWYIFFCYIICKFNKFLQPLDLELSRWLRYIVAPTPNIFPLLDQEQRFSACVTEDSVSISKALPEQLPLLQISVLGWCGSCLISC